MRVLRAPWFVTGGLLAGLMSGLAYGTPAGGAAVGSIAGWLAWALAEHDDDEGGGEPIELEEPLEHPLVRLVPEEG